MANLAILKIGKHTFIWKWSVPFVWFMPFSLSSYKNGILRTKVGDAKEKILSMGITLEKVEAQLAMLTMTPKELWVKYRNKWRLGTLEERLKINALYKKGSNEIDVITYNDEIISEFDLEILEEDEGLYEITLLYKMLLVLKNEKDNVIISLDVSEIEEMGGTEHIIDLYNKTSKSFINKMIAYTAIFNFLLVNREREKIIHEKLQNFNENKLINDIIIPLLLKMGFQNLQVVSHHGPMEFGLDIRPFYEITKFGKKIYYGAQVKKININLNSKKQGNAVKIAYQLDVALNWEFIDDEDNTKKRIDKVMLITSGKINDFAKKYLIEKFGRRIELVDGILLAKNLVKYGLDIFILSLQN